MSDPSTGAVSLALTSLTSIKTTAGTVRFVDLANTGTATAYLSLFDAAGTTAVALGTTAAKVSIPVAGSATRTLGDLDLKFVNGIVAAAVTTFNGGTIAASALTYNGTFD